MNDAWLSGSERIGVVTGLAAEARLVRRLGWRVAVGGGDHAGAARAARELAEAGMTALLSFGLAGGLDPTISAGALVVPATVKAGQQSWDTTPEFAEKLGGVTPHVLLGAPVIARTASEKRRLWERTGCAAVDLESAAVAAEAHRRGLAVAVLRAICDPAAMDLPPVALIALSRGGTVNVLRVANSLATRPSQLGDLLRLAIYAARARRALASRLATVRTDQARRPAA